MVRWLAICFAILQYLVVSEDAPAVEVLVPSFYQGFEQCNIWAKEDKECLNNPRFMWSACLGACIEHAEDNDKECEEWAHSKECSGNPNYIQIHCPRRCGLAIAWNPWTRRELGIEEIPNIKPYHEDNFEITDIISAAEAMHRRIKVFMVDCNPHVIGLVTTAPSEYLGLVGMTEAFLYTLRLQEVILRKVGSDLDIETHRLHLEQVLLTIRQAEFNADLLSREMSFWLPFLDESATAIETSVRALPLKLTLDPVEVARYFIGYDDEAVTAGSNHSEISDKIADSLTLHQTGGLMPKIGLGTWQLEGEECYQAVMTAIKLGYRHIDSAQAYRNEADVGRAIKDALSQSLVSSRADLFIATKLSDSTDAGYENVQRLVHSQLQALQIEYIDLYYLHSPLGNAQLQQETWRALEDLQKQGLIKALAVSNFDPNDLQQLLATSTIKPSVVQNKLDPYHIGKQLDVHGDEIVRFCKEHQIILLSYSSFSAYPFTMQPVSDPLIMILAKAKNITPSQLILQWILQRGDGNMAVIPRSSSEQHLRENMMVLKFPRLTKEEVAVMDTLQHLVSSPVSVTISLD